MEFIFSDKNVDNYKVTMEHSIEEFIYPDIKTGFELYGMHLRTAKSTWYYPAHEHPMYEINLVTEGHQVFEVKEEKYDQYAGDIILTRPGEIHSSRGGSKDPFTYFCLHFFY